MQVLLITFPEIIGWIVTGLIWTAIIGAGIYFGNRDLHHPDHTHQKAEDSGKSLTNIKSRSNEHN